jgi:hypothetical protein
VVPQGKGLENLCVFPKGLPRVVHGLNVQATAPAANIANVLNAVLQQTLTPRLGVVVIFPVGILNPEAFQVNVSMGNTVVVGVTKTGGQ